MLSLIRPKVAQSRNPAWLLLFAGSGKGGDGFVVAALGGVEVSVLLYAFARLFVANIKSCLLMGF